MPDVAALPIGIQDFEKLRQEQRIYFDKTACIRQRLLGLIHEKLFLKRYS